MDDVVCRGPSFLKPLSPIVLADCEEQNFASNPVSAACLTAYENRCLELQDGGSIAEAPASLTESQ